MASTYSSRLRLELIGSGEQAGAWGNTTNTNLGTLIEEAISGSSSISIPDVASPDYSLTTNSGASDQARQAVLVFNGALTAARTVVAPASSKLYVIKNDTTGGFAVNLKAFGGSTVLAIPNGSIVSVYYDSVSNAFVRYNIGSDALSDFITTKDVVYAAQTQSVTAFDAAGTSTAYTLNTSSAPIATFSGSISVGTLTVDLTTLKGTIAIGMVITGSSIPAGSIITAGSGASWTTNVAIAVSSTSITGTAGLIPKERFRVKFNVTSGVAPTLALNGLLTTNIKLLKQYDATGSKVPAVVYANQLTDIEYDGTDYVVLESIQPLGQLSPLGVTQSAGAMTITLNPTTLDFRNSSVDVTTANTVTTLSVPTAITLTIPATATLGTTTATANKLLVLAINNGGTVELAVCNIWNNTNLNEALTINTTTISTGATSAVTNYSTTGRAGVYFRVIGELASTQTTAGTWASLPTIKSGGAWTPLVNYLTSGTLQTAPFTSPYTSATFTGIPSWVRRITVMLNGISTSGTSDIIVRIGPTTVPEASGYLGSAYQAAGPSSGSNATDNGFCIAPSVANATVFYGTVVLTLLNGSTWVSSSNLARSDTNASITGAGSKTITGALGVVRLTTVNGTDTFDAGTVNIMYE
jgi:hypothetical protein